MFEFNLIKLKNYFLIILILISVISLYIYLNQEDDFLAFNTENICGEYPADFIKEDISSNPNYVFVNDPSFVSTKLWDEFGNTVFVNSFIECEHYVSGGWNFRPNENFVAVESDPCLVKENLKEVLNSNEQAYLKDIDLRSFFSENNFLCMGKIYNTHSDNNTKYFEVLYSRRAYIVLSQLVPILFLIFYKKISLKNYTIFLILYQMIIQYIFNYKFGLSLINSVSIFPIFIILLFLNEVKNENTV